MNNVESPQLTIPRVMHRFSYRWTLKDAVFTKDKGKVFSCFACGGGSTMGYKLAGFDVIGCNEIDHKRTLLDIEYIYGGSFPTDYVFQKNKPKYLIGMSVPPVMTAQIATQIYQQWLMHLT